jgi:hypothetical protein
MAERISDASIFATIQGLVHEEQGLYGQDQLSDHDHVRLEQITVELDQRWDLCGSATRAASSARILTARR